MSENGEKSPLRHFKILEDGEKRGRFSGRKPKQAASKALTSILNKEGISGKSDKINLTIVECTRGSKNREYSYVGQRVKLKNPTVLAIGGEEIVYNYSNILSKAQPKLAEGGVMKGDKKTKTKPKKKEETKKTETKPKKKIKKEPTKNTEKPPIKKIKDTTEKTKKPKVEKKKVAEKSQKRSVRKKQSKD